jgi:tetratricopeptide (TPR) repeat protein
MGTANLRVATAESTEDSLAWTDPGILSSDFSSGPDLAAESESGPAASSSRLSCLVGLLRSDLSRRSQIVRAYDREATAAARQQRLPACIPSKLLLALLQRRVVVALLALLRRRVVVALLAMDSDLPPFIYHHRLNYCSQAAVPNKYVGQFGVRGGVVHVYHPAGGPFDSVAETQAAVQARQAQEGYVAPAIAAQQSSVKGVYFNKGKDTFSAVVMGKHASRLNNGKRKMLGNFKDREDAERCLAAWIAARENGEVRWIPAVNHLMSCQHCTARSHCQLSARLMLSAAAAIDPALGADGAQEARGYEEAIRGYEEAIRGYEEAIRGYEEACG